jgi:hypothetical protein
MTIFNVVRFKVKPGMEEAFLNAHRGVAWPGMLRANMIHARRAALGCLAAA